MGLRGYLQRLFARRDDAELRGRLGELQKEAPVPVFWLFGKTQSGKTSLVKFLTGAADAEIGQGFKPTTRFSRQYDFPSEEAPLLTFLDTRGLDEPGYDSAEDIERFHDLAHAVLVTVRIMDHAQERVLKHLRRIRADQPDRPVVLVLTCLHEAYPQQQHPQPYPFSATIVQEESKPGSVDEGLWRSLVEQRRRFEDLVDHVVPVDLTKPEEGFGDPNYGGELLKATLLQVLPDAYRQTLERVEALLAVYQGEHDRPALPYILGYSTLAATAGAFPVPWVNLLVLPAIQTRMVEKLAAAYGAPESAKEFLESAAGLGLTRQQAIRELAKFIPGVGPLTAAALAGRATYALGKAYCYFRSNAAVGQAPDITQLKRYYEAQLRRAEEVWKGPPTPAPQADGR
jgi:uncharacterized protein (DUF697 family)/predicted GTPase